VHRAFDGAPAPIPPAQLVCLRLRVFPYFTNKTSPATDVRDQDHALAGDLLVRSLLSEAVELGACEIMTWLAAINNTGSSLAIVATPRMGGVLSVRRAGVDG
jgi:hypothetical protein